MAIRSSSTSTYRRIAVIGPGGSGKSTLARRLGSRTGLPVVHLDALYWRAGWEPTPAAEWRATMEALVRAPEWIMDGNYGGTLDVRLAACDSVVFLDMPRWLCLARVLLRWLRYAGRTRPDMTPGCPERANRAFLAWVWQYPKRRRPAVLRRLAELPPDRRVHVLRSPRAVERWLHTVPQRA